MTDGSMHANSGPLHGTRILFVYRFCGLGGVETSILTKARALRAAGADACVLFSQYYGEGGKSVGAEPGVWVGLGKAEVRELLRQEFDAIVIVDYPQFLPIVEAAGVRSKVLFETHSSLLFEANDRRSGATTDSFPRLFERLQSSIVGAIIVPSRFNQSLIAAGGLTAKPFALIPNPIDTDVFRRLPRHELLDIYRGLLDRPILLWVGRLGNDKNPVEMVRIAAALARGPRAPQLVIVGDTADYDAYCRMLKHQVRPGEDPRITFIRHVANAEMPQLYSLAAETGGGLVSTSLHEAQPMIMLEAMACECPIVASAVDGVPDLIRDGVNGRLYASGDIEGAVAILTELLDVANAAMRARIIAGGVATVHDHHALTAVAPLYQAALQQVPARTDSFQRRPLVSGVVIFLNGENFLQDAIESVLAQTYDNWELLLVDDGSTDRSTSIAQEYAERYPGKIRYLEHDGHQNRRKSASRNLGIRHARGEYLALLDHDDVWLPNKLEEQVAILNAYPEVAMVYGRARFWYSWTETADDRQRDGLTVLGVEPDTVVEPPLLVTLFLRDEQTLASPCTVMIRRELANQVGGFDESFPDIYEDVAFFSKLYLRFPVFVADACWGHYRQHPGNSMSAAFRSGEWHPNRPNARREHLFVWLEQHLQAHQIHDADLDRALATALQPYRQPEERTTRQRFYDAALDGTLALLRGETPDAVLAALATATAPDLDPQTVAERVFEAVPSSTWNAPSWWLTVSPKVRADVALLLEAIERQAQAPGLARQSRHVLDQLIAGTWLLRVADGHAATLHFLPEVAPGVRIEVTNAVDGASWDVQLNWPHQHAVADDRLRIRFRARSDQARRIGVGFAQAHPPWENLGLYHAVELAPEWATFEVDFVATQDEDSARVHFDLGGSNSSIEVSDLSLTSELNSVQAQGVAASHDLRVSGQRALILMYHRVANASQDPWSLSVSAQHFAEHLAVLGDRERRFHPARLADCVQGTTGSDRAVAVTFDDGYADNLLTAVPLLQQHGIPASVFVVAGQLDLAREFWWDELGRIFLSPGTLPERLDISIDGEPLQWNLGAAAVYADADWARQRHWTTNAEPPGIRQRVYLELWRRIQPLPPFARVAVMDDLCRWANLAPIVRDSHRTMSSEEVVALGSEPLIDVGAHTMTHPILPALSVAMQQSEIAGSKIVLERVLGRPVTSFSYPYGAHSDETIDLVRQAGFTSACMTRPGLAESQRHVFQVPRITVLDWDGEEFARQLSVWLG